MIKQDCIRTGEDAVSVTTAHANFVVRELAKHGIASAKSENKPKRVLKLHHMTNDGITKLSIWPFLSNLKCVSDARAGYAQRVLDQAAKTAEKKEKQKKKKAEAKAAKEAAAAAAVANPAPAASTPEPAAPTDAAQQTPPVVEKAAESVAVESKDEPKEKRVKTPEADFEHHSQNIIREVIQEQEGKLEISSDVKSFCARVVYEMLSMYGGLIQNQTSYAGVKTIKASTIYSIAQFILTYSHAQCPGLSQYVTSWLKKQDDEAAKAKAEKEAKSAVAGSQSAPPTAAVVTVAA
jgi:hypothetical protein